MNLKKIFTIIILLLIASPALAGPLGVSFDSEPSSTGDISLYWFAEESARGEVSLEYGPVPYYSKSYNFNITGPSGLITLKGLKPGITYHYKLKQGENETREHKFVIMREDASQAEPAANLPIIIDASEGAALDSSGSETNSNKKTFTEKCILGEAVSNNSLYEKLKGKIILKVEELGQAFYINPIEQKIHCLGGPKDAFDIMRGLGIGINNLNLAKIPIGYAQLGGKDTDRDGLSDIFEDAVWSNKYKADSNENSILDKNEIIDTKKPIGRYSLVDLDMDFAKGHSGKIFLQVLNNGEAWYIYPGNTKRYFLGRPRDAFSIMTDLGLGIANNDFEKLK